MAGRRNLVPFPVECGFIQHVGEGGGVGKGKKDTGYLYKALMVARRWGCDRVPPICKQREQDSPEIRGRVKSISYAVVCPWRMAYCWRKTGAFFFSCANRIRYPCQKKNT